MASESGGGSVDPATLVVELILLSALGWAAYAGVASLFRDKTGVQLPLDPNPTATSTPGAPVLVPQ